MKSTFKVTNQQGNGLTVPGVRLLRIMHEAVAKILDTCKLDPNTKARLCKSRENATLKMNGLDWLMAAGHLSNSTTATDVTSDNQKLYSTANNTSSYFQIGNEPDAPRVKITSYSGEAIVSFFGYGDTYSDITRTLLSCCSDENVQVNVAEQLLMRLHGNCYFDNIKNHPIAKVLDALLLLMFGVEASRNNDTLLTSLFLLDLIRAKQVYGKNKDKRFDWKCAFISRHGYQWDDNESNSYAGKYPMAQTSTGSGNLGQGTPENPGRGAILFAKKQVPPVCELDAAGKPTKNIDWRFGIKEYVYSEEEAQSIFEKAWQRHAIPRREMSIVIHWLEAYSQSETFNTCNNIVELELAIKMVFIERLGSGFVKQEDCNKFYLRSPSHNNNPQGVNQLANNLTQLNLTEAEQDQSAYVYRLFHMSSKNEVTTHKDGKLHKDLKCKLISEYTLFGKSKTLYNGYSIESHIVTPCLPAEKQVKTELCSYCCK